MQGLTADEQSQPFHLKGDWFVAETSAFTLHTLSAFHKRTGEKPTLSHDCYKPSLLYEAKCRCPSENAGS